jgi:hypothetical protein
MTFNEVNLEQSFSELKIYVNVTSIIAYYLSWCILDFRT